MTKVYLFDLWMTLVHSLPVDPILTLQKRLGYKVPASESGSPLVLDDEFLTACLTTNIPCESGFLATIGRQFGITLEEQHFHDFSSLLKAERDGVKLYDESEAVLSALKARGERLAIVSNLWPFPVDHIFNKLGLAAHFRELVFSYEVGTRKPGARIFVDACRRFGVTPSECVMVGDSLGSDIAGAVAIGMPAVFVNRSGKTVELPTGVREVRSLTELL